MIYTLSCYTSVLTFVADPRLHGLGGKGVGAKLYCVAMPPVSTLVSSLMAFVLLGANQYSLTIAAIRAINHEQVFMQAQPIIDHLYTTTTIHLTRNDLPPRPTP